MYRATWLVCLFLPCVLFGCLEAGKRTTDNTSPTVSGVTDWLPLMKTATVTPQPQ